MNILSEIIRVARKNPNKKIIIDLPSAREFTYAGVIKEIESIAGALIGAGVREGDKVLLMAGNSPEFIFVFLAVLRVNAVCVPLRPGLMSYEIEKILKDSQPRLITADASYLKNASITELLAKYAVYSVNGGSEKYRDLSGLKKYTGAKLPKIRDGRRLTASINYTYKGTGIALGVMAPHELYYYGAKALASGQRKWAGQRMMVILPVAHIFALIACVMVPLLKKAVIYFCSSLMPDSIFKAAEKHRIETITAVPEIFEMLAKFKNSSRNLSSLKLLISGGSALSKESFHKIKETFGVELLHGYGLTEFTPVSRNIEKTAAAGSIGPVCPGIKARIAAPDENGKGEIEIKSENLFLGYYNNSGETARAFSEDGWFKTGDMGYFSGGHLYFERELKRTCKKNGSMVDLAELENVAGSLNSVAKAQASFENGKLKLNVEFIGGGARMTAAELKIRLRELVAGWKIPDVIEVEGQV